MRFVPRMFTVLSKLDFGVAVLLIGFYSLLLLVAAIIAFLLTLDTEYARALDAAGAREIFEHESLLGWMSLSTVCVGVIFWTNGIVFRSLSRFASAKLANEPVNVQANHLKSVPKLLFVIYMLGMIVSLLETQSPTFPNPETEHALLSWYVAFADEHVIPGFYGALSLVFAALIRWYVLDLQKTSELEETTTRLQHEAELTI